MAFWKSEHCPLCGKKISMLNTIRIKDNIAVCRTCFANLDIDFAIAKFQTIQSLNERRAQRNENYRTFLGFNTTREVSIGGLWSKTYFREDNRLKMWYFSHEKNPQNPTLYRYDEIADFELLEDGNTVTSGGLGRAVVGGALFGGVGAIVGAVTGGKTTKKIVNSLSVNITLNNPYINSISIPCLSAGPCQTDSIVYRGDKHMAQQLINFLNSMCSRAVAPQLPPIPPTPSAAISPVDEVLRYKELLDKGIITPEQFETKKKELLGL